MAAEPPSQPQTSPSPAFPVVGFASSGGGIEALQVIIHELPTDFPAAVIVVQHLSPAHPSHLAEILQGKTNLRVEQAVNGARLLPGLILIAPPDWHVVVDEDDRLKLDHGPKIHFLRPAADVLFESMAEHLRQRAVAVVLTGAGTDGASGALAVKGAGGRVIVQDEASAQHPSMPRAAVMTGAVDEDDVLPMAAIAGRLGQLVRGLNE